MQIFRGSVEITAKNAVPGLRAGRSKGLSNAHIRLTDAAMANLQRPRTRPAANLQGATAATSSDLEKSSKNKRLSEPEKRGAA
jgi:hypothetical protein